MGLLKGLALLPLAPVNGVIWIAEQLQEQAERQLLDPESILVELAELQSAVDEGLLPESEYLEMEEALLDRLDEMRAAE